MPKAESHVHLDGSLSPATVLRLARERGHEPLASLDLEAVRRLTVVDSPRPSLAQVLEVFRVVYPLLRDARALESVAYDLLAAAAAANTRYVEVRFAPALQAAEGFGQGAALDAVLAGLERGRRELGVESAVILCLIRPDALVSRAANLETLELALARRGRGVVAVDLAGDEAAAPLSDYADLFLSARRGGLALTAHAGEAPGGRDLDTALELEVDRLGHGTDLARRPELLAEVLRRDIPIEVNLTSNLRTGAIAAVRDHPVRAWFRAGVPIALGTDDPGVFGNDLAGEYLLLHRELGFSPQELATVALQGVDALFLPASRRDRLRRRCERELVRLLDELAHASAGPPAAPAR